jgi:hypothetical protein
MRISILFFTFLVLFTHSSFSQGFDLGSWNILHVKFNHNDKWSGFGEAQLRSLKFYHNFHYYEVKGGIHYNVYRNVKLSLAAGTYQTYREGGDFVTPKNNNEFRIWPQVILTQSIVSLKVEQRYRIECRYTSNGYRNRFRYRLGLSYPFGKDKNGFKPFQVGLSNEIFFTDNEPYFERNRALISFNYKFTKSSTIQLGYLQQFDYKINDETGRDFLQLGYYIDIDRKTESKK